MTVKGNHPIRKCPFLEPLVGRTGDSLIRVQYQDCLRDECQIWDGSNCSLHHERK